MKRDWTVCRALLLTAAALAAATMGACREVDENPLHCGNAAGDATCAAEFPDGSRPFCALPSCTAEPYGCVVEQPDDACYSPCGESLALVDDPECFVTDESDSTSETEESTTETETTDGTGGCEADADCIGSALGEVCIDGACVECSPDDASACQGESPVCDPDTLACTACRFHFECPLSACNIDTGSCMPDDRVWHVDANGRGDFATIADALAEVGPGELGTVVVHENGTGYDEAVVVSEGRTIALIGASDEDRPQLDFASGTSITAESESVLYLGRVDVAGVEPLHVGGARVVVDDSTMIGSVSHVVRLENGARLTSRNSMLVGSGNLEFNGPVISVAASEFELIFSTLVAPVAGLVACDDPVSESEVRSSILLGTPSLPCAGLLVSDSILENDQGFPGNIEVGPYDPAWFAGPLDLHLSPLAPLGITLAGTWAVGDPRLDFDGEPRDLDGDVVAGADQP